MKNQFWSRRDRDTLQRAITPDRSGFRAMEQQSPEQLSLKVVNLRKWFPVRLGLVASLLSSRENYVKAVDGVSFGIRRKEIFGLVGESGSGKTTTGRAILRLT